MQKILTHQRLFSISLVAVSLVLVTLPLKNNLNSFSILFLSVLALFQWFGTQEKAKMTPVFWAFIGFFVWACLSFFWSDDQQESLKAFRKLLPFLLLPISIQFVDQKSTKWTTKILSYFSLGMVICSIYCLLFANINFIETKDRSYFFYHYLSEPLFGMSAIYMSLFIAFSFFFLYYQAPFKSWQNKVLLFFLLVMIILLSSKVLVVSTFLILIADQLKRKKYKALILFIPLVLVMLWKSFSSDQIQQRVILEVEKTNVNEVLTTEKFGQVYHWTGFGLRLFQAKCFYELFDRDKKYIQGYGFLASQEKLTEKYQEYDLYPDFFSYNFHNQYLQTTADLGLFGLVMMLFLLLMGFKRALTEKSPLFFVFILLMTLICITESVLWRQWGMVFFVTLYCLLYLQPLQRTSN
ncbi:O-antigen ligase family protein [Namhaeicola litoreus]|uniref:O-antigen ligase family protein n=1 Tax=Namhaeicola litoreus TaxID=1052145 RepID=A0ABW3Y2H5_9FLAO